jgi:pilus assembly protein CpaC
VHRFRRIAGILFAGAWLSVTYAQNSATDEAPPRTQQAGASASPEKLIVTVGKSMIIDSPVNIQRISYADATLVEAVAVGPKEVLLNGKAAGETSLIIWQQGGTRLLYDLTVRLSTNKLDIVRQQIARDFPNDDINVTFENDTAFVRGSVKDVTAAERVMAMVATLGGKPPINLLRVQVPPVETQILLKVRFANVDRSAQQDLGISFASGAFNQATQIGTGQFAGPQITNGVVSISDALNVLLFRKDINLAATIKALESKALLETLAEPNVLAINGKVASFVSGGEFPYPMVQGGAVGSVTIAFREYGIRINFLPKITPRGTIQLQVTPEVSALDFANAVAFQGFTIPALTTRRVNTEVELESGQSFMIAGLLDNSMTESLNKIPGLSSIPLFGKLFQSRERKRSNTELLVLVTPEVVRPLPAGQPAPMLHMPYSFMEPNSDFPMHHPSIDKTGPVPVKPPSETMPLEELIQQRREGQPPPQPTMPQMMLVPMPAAPSAAQGQAPVASAPAPTPTAGGTGK